MFHGSRNILNTDPDQLYLPLDNAQQDTLHDALYETSEQEPVIIGPLQSIDSGILHEATHSLAEETTENIQHTLQLHLLAKTLQMSTV